MQKLTRCIFPLFFILTLMLAPASTAPVIAAPDAPLQATITGTVTSPGGYPLPTGTLVKLFDPGTENVRGHATPDVNNGTFSLGPVPNGLYIIKAVPPAASPFTQSEPKPVSVFNNPVTVGALALTNAQITGTVFAPDGTTPVNALISVLLGNGKVLQSVTASGGSFQLGGLPAGSYALRAYPGSDDPYWQSAALPVTISGPTDSHTVSLTLTNAKIWGTATDAQTRPIASAVVIASRANGPWQTILSRASGYWAIGGLTDGTYKLAIQPPAGHHDLLPPAPQQITLPGQQNPIHLAFLSPHKAVNGSVRTNTNAPVSKADIIARRTDQHGEAQTQTANDGTYSLELTPGLWYLTVQANADTAPSGWVFPRPPQLVFFQHNQVSEDLTQNFKVILADATVTGKITLPSGAVPGFPVTIYFYTDEGVGLNTDANPADGTFSIHLPNGGYKVVVASSDPRYLGPVMDPINLKPNASLDLGVISLVARDAMVSGTITDANGNGVEGIPIVAWQTGQAGSLRATSGPDGSYGLTVSAGEWHIQPAPGPQDPYLYTGGDQVVTLISGQQASGVNFGLTNADATISGLLVDANGNLLNDADGWASADQVGGSLHNGAPVDGGIFTIYVPAGTYHLAVHLPAGSPYVSSSTRQVQANAGSTTQVTLTLQVKTAVIKGSLWDPRSQLVVSGVPGLVGVRQDANLGLTPIRPGNGTYQIDVSAGLWQLNYRIDPDEGYIKPFGPRNIPVQDGQTAVVPLPLLAKDASVSGIVRDPTGTPLAGATIIANGTSVEVRDLHLETTSQSNGTFSLNLPYGVYRVKAVLKNSGWLQPVDVTVMVPKGGSSSGHTLQFRNANAALSGALTLQNSNQTGKALVWAWSDDGAFTRGRFDLTNGAGSYSLQVVSGTTWHVGAVFETKSQYWAGRSTLDINGSSTHLDLALNGPKARPAPVAVTFDPAEEQNILLADGTQIDIPAGALPAAGPVTLRIVPTFSLPSHYGASLFKYGYSFLATDANGQAIEQHFNQDVIIQFGYTDPELAAQGTTEERIRPAYYSTTTDLWTMPDSYTIDTQANQISMQIDHFTDFAVLDTPETGIFLPMIKR